MTYRRVFCTEYQLSSFKPTKEQCLQCVKKTKSNEKSEECFSHISQNADAKWFKPKIKHVSPWNDICGGQNRNKFIAVFLALHDA